MQGATETRASITPAELYEKHQRGEVVTLIDVRTPAEFREVHATLARLVPLDRLDAADLVRSSPGSDSPLYVICRSGGRGEKACERLRASGLTNLVNVEGGTLAWEAAGLPVVRGKKTMALERQVRIAAGSLVLLGTLLGAFVHPYFLGLAGFVGAGLVFAGITDTCGMGMLLARMPWNRVSEEGPSCSASA
jgi:rhodanese-related sulfurtransferase